MKPIQDNLTLTELILENNLVKTPPVFKHLEVENNPLLAWALGERLLFQTEDAKYFPCDSCEEGCPREISRIEDGTGSFLIKAVCPEDRMVRDIFPTEDEIKRYQVNQNSFYKRLCECNDISYEPIGLDTPVVYLGTRIFDGESVLFFTAAKVNNNTVEAELLKISTQKPQNKKCVIIPPRIRISPGLETRLNDNNVFAFPVSGKITDGKFRFNHYSLGMSLKISVFSFDALSEDGYQLILNPRNSNGCFLGTLISPTKDQFRILMILAANADKGVLKDSLFDQVYNAENADEVEALPSTQNPLDNHLKRLRQLLDQYIKKDSDVPKGNRLIETSRGQGTVTLHLPPEKVLILPE